MISELRSCCAIHLARKDGRWRKPGGTSWNVCGFVGWGSVSAPWVLHRKDFGCGDKCPLSHLVCSGEREKPLTWIQHDSAYSTSCTKQAKQIKAKWSKVPQSIIKAEVPLEQLQNGSLALEPVVRKPSLTLAAPRPEMTQTISNRFKPTALQSAESESCASR